MYAIVELFLGAKCYYWDRNGGNVCLRDRSGGRVSTPPSFPSRYRKVADQDGFVSRWGIQLVQGEERIGYGHCGGREFVWIDCLADNDCESATKR